MSGGQTRTELIRDLVREGMALEDIVERVISFLTEDDRASLIRSHISVEIRRCVGIETKFAAGKVTSVGRPNRSPSMDVLRSEFIAHASRWNPAEDPDPGERLSRRAELLMGTFVLPGHGFVKWGEATEAQHAARASALEKLGASVFESAHLHRRAISEIRAANVKNLNQIVDLRHANERQLAS